MTILGLAVLALIIMKMLVEIGLEQINQRHVRRHATAVPAGWSAVMDPATYQRSVQYTLAKGRLGQLEAAYGALVLAGVLFSGLLPWAHDRIVLAFGQSIWTVALFMLSVVAGLSLVHLPWHWHTQFGVEARFGFNTTSPRLWWLDQLKGLGLGIVLGYPLLVLLVAVIGWAGPWWWLWAWGCLTAFQLAMWVVAPHWIMPLFNKFTRLPDGDLREELLALSHRIGFPASNVQVMDGSKRSRHSNAFFTGFGRYRKIVLYDTLLQQLLPAELKSVLAHEIGHSKLGHLRKLFLISAGASLAGFYVMSLLAGQPWFYQAFGFAPGQLPIALLLFGLLSGLGAFWLSPLVNGWSRRYEYQADAFARRATGEAHSLLEALRKLASQNLSNLTPHPLYSRFYYGHPTLLERERALTAP